MESTQTFLKCAGIEEPNQIEYAVVLRNVLAQNLGISTNDVYASSHPNTLLKSAKKNWDDNDFIIDLEEHFGIDETLAILDRIPSLFSYKFFFLTFRKGADNIGEWVYAVSKLYVDTTALVHEI
jgi:hypothetical protein